MFFLKIIFGITVFLTANLTYAEIGTDQVSNWLSEVVGVHSLRGSEGCQRFNIVLDETSIGLISFVDFGEKRTPQENLILSESIVGPIKVLDISSNVISYKFKTRKGMFTDSQSVKVDIEKEIDGSINKMNIATNNGFFGITKNISCRK